MPHDPLGRIIALEQLSEMKGELVRARGVRHVSVVEADKDHGASPFVRGRALGEATLRIMSAATINLNVHADFVWYGGNIRLFEAAGVGRLQIADHLPGTLQWFSEGENIVTFRDLDDLRAKVAYYLAHEAEREAIGQRGREHVYAQHSFDERVPRIEALIEALAG